jgi:hypothetical protein
MTFMTAQEKEQDVYMDIITNQINNL